MKKAIIIIAVIVLLAGIVFTATIAPRILDMFRMSDISSAPSEFIGKEAAKGIAMEKVGVAAEEARFDRTKLEHENGTWKYEVEFMTGGVEYNVDIDAVDGSILKWEVDKQ